MTVYHQYKDSLVKIVDEKKQEQDGIKYLTGTVNLKQGQADINIGELTEDGLDVSKKLEEIMESESLTSLQKRQLFSLMVGISKSVTSKFSFASKKAKAEAKIAKDAQNATALEEALAALSSSNSKPTLEVVKATAKKSSSSRSKSTTKKAS